MNDAQIKHMVDRFLGWRLPKPWHPDNGISYQRPNYAHAPADHDWPTGTNLFGADEAREMVQYMLDALPEATTPEPNWNYMARAMQRAPFFATGSEEDIEAALKIAASIPVAIGDWIEHKAVAGTLWTGEDDATVDIRLSDGTEKYNESWDSWDWSDEGDPQIVAYRIRS